MSNGPATLMVPPSEQLFGLLVDGMKRANDRVDEERVAREAALGRLYDKVDHGFTNLRAHIDAQHAETQERLRQVCDKGGLEHDRFTQNDLDRKAEIIDLRHRLDRAAAMEDGRKQVRGSMLRAGAWVIENGKGIAAEFLAEADRLGAVVRLAASPLDDRTNLRKLIAFYERHGFQRNGARANQLGHPIMERKPRAVRSGEGGGPTDGKIA